MEHLGKSLSVTGRNSERVEEAFSRRVDVKLLECELPGCLFSRIKNCYTQA